MRSILEKKTSRSTILSELDADFIIEDSVEFKERVTIRLPSFLAEQKIEH